MQSNRCVCTYIVLKTKFITIFKTKIFNIISNTILQYIIIANVSLNNSIYFNAMPPEPIDE